MAFQHASVDPNERNAGELFALGLVLPPRLRRPNNLCRSRNGGSALGPRSSDQRTEVGQFPWQSVTAIVRRYEDFRSLRYQGLVPGEWLQSQDPSPIYQSKPMRIRFRAYGRITSGEDERRSLGCYGHIDALYFHDHSLKPRELANYPVVVNYGNTLLFGRLMFQINWFSRPVPPDRTFITKSTTIFIPPLADI
jgi:hypothetical protein